MADAGDVLLKMVEEQWAQARQCEYQRSIASDFIIVMASAIIGFIVKTNLGREAIPLSVFLMILGVFGALLCAKFYERFYLHVQRVGRMMERLDQLYDKAGICSLEATADIAHNKRFPMMSHIRLHVLWLTIHVVIAVIGLVCTLLLAIRGTLLGAS
jgi:hypothetical protein